MSCANPVGVILNLAMPFFVKWVRGIYLSACPAEGYKSFEGLINREMLECQWNLEEISGFCLFFAAADIFCIAGALRRRGSGRTGRKMSEPLVILSYALKASALIVFVLMEIF